MKYLIISFLIFGYLFTISISTVAQKRWSAEFRPGINFLTRKTPDKNLETGYGIEGTVAYGFVPNLGGYAGWLWNKFSTDQSIEGTNIDFKETGYTFGLQLIQPLSSKINYLIRGGGIYNHIKVENDDGGTIAESDNELGWQIETGLSFSSEKRLRITPSLRYRSLSSDIEIENVLTEVNLSYLSAGIGLTWHFGKKVDPGQ